MLLREVYSRTFIAVGQACAMAAMCSDQFRRQKGFYDASGRTLWRAGVMPAGNG
jgi:hypothetical protein